MGADWIDPMQKFPGREVVSPLRVKTNLARVNQALDANSNS
jgi:hypothetical protein